MNETNLQQKYRNMVRARPHIDAGYSHETYGINGTLRPSRSAGHSYQCVERVVITCERALCCDGQHLIGRESQAARCAHVFVPN